MNDRRIREIEDLVRNEPDRAEEWLVLAICELARQLARFADIYQVLS